MWWLRSRNVVLIVVLLLTAGCGRRVLLRDGFSNPGFNAWFLEQDMFGRTLIADDLLYIQINEPNTMQYATLQTSLYEDFVATVDATLLQGSLDSSYGILFRMQQDGAFYRFDITGRGAYIVERRDPDGTWLRYTPNQRWEQSDAIQTGLGETNTMRVAAVGRDVIFSVNGIVVQQFANSFDINYGNGSLALDAGTFGSGNTQVAFDNFTIEEP